MKKIVIYVFKFYKLAFVYLIEIMVEEKYDKQI